MNYFLKFFGWLRHLVFLWVRSTLLAKDLIKELNLDINKPICYVLRARSFKDSIVLDHHCCTNKLPRPIESLFKIKNSQNAALLYLNKPGLLQENRTSKLPKALLQLVKFSVDQNVDIQIVPISVFWGRNPGKEEKSLFKLLFFDDKYGGFFQRFITFFVHGRNVFCSFGKPIYLKDLINKKMPPEDNTKKLKRILKIHFRRVRETIVGPYIYDRQQVINSIISEPSIRKLIEKEARTSKHSIDKINRKAKKYADEICSNASPSTIRFFDILLSWLWKKIYSDMELHQASHLRELSEEYVHVYMPCHRSHMDYLLIGYVLYYLGLVPPHTIAGNNLNFWPVGPLLKGGGGIFIRRSFKGDRLYGAIVNSFMQYLIRTGFPVCFYPEGGRSRSGFLLPPKLGILSMVVESIRKKTKKPILFIPIFLGYDKLFEGDSFATEMRGAKKKTESFAQLLRARKIIKNSAGKAYIGFGEPLSLSEYLEKNVPNWENSPRFKGSIIRSIAFEIAVRTNSAAIITPVSLFSLIILSTPKKAINESDLLSLASILINLGKNLEFNKRHHFPNADELSSLLKDVKNIGHIKIFNHENGNVVYINESESTLLHYYRNNIVHVYALSSLISSFIKNTGKIHLQELIRYCIIFYKFLKPSFFLPWNSQNIEQGIKSTLNILLELKLIEVDQNEYYAPPPLISQNYIYLQIITNMTENIIKKFALYGGMFGQYAKHEYFSLEDFEHEVKQMSRRLSILNGMSDNTIYDSTSYRTFFGILSQNKYIKEISASKQHINPSVTEITEPCKILLGQEIQQYIECTPLDSSIHSMDKPIEEQNEKMEQQKT